MSDQFASLRDRINWFQEPGALRTPVIDIVNAIQHLPPHWRVMSVAYTMYIICKVIGIDANDIYVKIRRMENHVNGPFANQIEAMTNYVKGEFNE